MEYLFRGKRLDNGEWVKGHFYKLGSQSFIRIDIHNYEVHPDTVGMWSGLVDGNGTKIFSGDHLYVCAGYGSVVEFIDGCFMSVYSHPEDGETIPLIDVICDTTEVIHDNPELLE